jgi:hypothetical protein
MLDPNEEEDNTEEISMATTLDLKPPLPFDAEGDNRDLKHVRRQRDDVNQNKLLQINYCDEELLCIIHSMYI